MNEDPAFAFGEALIHMLNALAIGGFALALTGTAALLAMIVPLS
jgi:hypothetical protein